MLTNTYSQHLDPYGFFMILAVVSGVCFAHYIIFVIDEMTTALGIRVFKVKPVNPPPAQ